MLLKRSLLNPTMIQIFDTHSASNLYKVDDKQGTGSPTTKKKALIVQGRGIFSFVRRGNKWEGS